MLNVNTEFLLSSKVFFTGFLVQEHPFINEQSMVKKTSVFNFKWLVAILLEEK